MKNEIISPTQNLELLENSKGFKSGLLSFETPNVYVNQVKEILSDLNIEKTFKPLVCKFENPVININEDGTENIAYPRFLLQYDSKLSKISTQTFTFGLLVALNISQPVIKTFSGLNTTACTNLSVFNADNLSISFLKDSNYKRVFSDLKNWLTTHADLAKNLLEKYNFLQETQVKDPHHFYGALLERTFKDKAPLQPVLDSFKATMVDDKSKYFGNLQLSNIYESLTDTISNKTNFLMQPNHSLYFFETLTNLKN